MGTSAGIPASNSWEDEFQRLAALLILRSLFCLFHLPFCKFMIFVNF